MCFNDFDIWVLTITWAFKSPSWKPPSRDILCPGLVLIWQTARNRCRHVWVPVGSGVTVGWSRTTAPWAGLYQAHFGIRGAPASLWHHICGCLIYPIAPSPSHIMCVYLSKKQRSFNILLIHVRFYYLREHILASKNTVRPHNNVWRSIGIVVFPPRSTRMFRLQRSYTYTKDVTRVGCVSSPWRSRLILRRKKDWLSK